MGFAKGYLQCFCDLRANKGDKADAEYVFYLNRDDENLLVCQDYITNKCKTLLSSNGITITIIIINFVLKQVTIMLVKWIGHKTHSQQMTKIME